MVAAADSLAAVVASIVILGAELPFDRMLAIRADLGP